MKILRDIVEIIGVQSIHIILQTLLNKICFLVVIQSNKYQNEWLSWPSYYANVLQFVLRTINDRDFPTVEAGQLFLQTSNKVTKNVSKVRLGKSCSI